MIGNGGSCGCRKAVRHVPVSARLCDVRPPASLRPARLHLLLLVEGWTHRLSSGTTGLLLLLMMMMMWNWCTMSTSSSRSCCARGCAPSVAGSFWACSVGSETRFSPGRVWAPGWRPVGRARLRTRISAVRTVPRAPVSAAGWTARDVGARVWTHTKSAPPPPPPRGRYSTTRVWSDSSPTSRIGHRRRRQQLDCGGSLRHTALRKHRWSVADDVGTQFVGWNHQTSAAVRRSRHL